jgi:hypothetical protein
MSGILGRAWDASVEWLNRSEQSRVSFPVQYLSGAVLDRGRRPGVCDRGEPKPASQRSGIGPGTKTRGLRSRRAQACESAKRYWTGDEDPGSAPAASPVFVRERRPGICDGGSCEDLFVSGGCVFDRSKIGQRPRGWAGISMVRGRGASCSASRVGVLNQCGDPHCCHHPHDYPRPPRRGGALGSCRARQPVKPMCLRFVGCPGDPFLEAFEHLVDSDESLGACRLEVLISRF